MSTSEAPIPGKESVVKAFLKTPGLVKSFLEKVCPKKPEWIDVRPNAQGVLAFLPKGDEEVHFCS